jgi:hypothetical protein
MARTTLVIALVGSIVSTILLGLFALQPSRAHAQVKVDPLADETRRRILQATVQIMMFRDEMREIDDGERLALLPISNVSRGIGTLVDYNGEAVMVTHNHWPQVEDATRPDRVQFRDAQGNLLLELDGVAFQSDILYRDGGTLVMKAPAALLDEVVPVNQIGDSRQVSPGDIIYVVRQQPGSEATLGLLATQVTAMEDDGSHVVMKLQSTEGQTVIPGDSGGGVWLNGVLIGNMWMTIQEEWRYEDHSQPTATITTDRSRAAGLTEGLLSLVGQSLDNLQEMATADGGFSME